jgi:hypothetical protein
MYIIHLSVSQETTKTVEGSLQCKLITYKIIYNYKQEWTISELR